MKAYRQQIKIDDPNRVILTGLPFPVGEEVEIIVQSKRRKADQLSRIQALFQKTQQLPQVRSISEEEIQKEIENFRNNE